MLDDDRRCKRALMHLVEMERDATCLETHAKGISCMLPQVRIHKIEELVRSIQDEIVACQDEVFRFSRDGVPSSLLA